MSITLQQRAYAGIWFIAAGIIPVSYVGWLMYSLSEAYLPATFAFTLWFTIISLLVAGIWGSLLGARILDYPKGARSAWLSVWRGFLVSTTSFLSSTMLIAVWDVATNEYSNFGGTLILFLVVGAVGIGWWAVIVGMIAGWLLYQRESSRRAE